MKTISVSARAKAVNELLKQARRGTVILESADGRRFALTALDDWEGFDVGSGGGFAAEVERTAKNKRLMQTLAARRKRAKRAAVPLAEVRKRLGIE